jgi:hypothetical protein
MSSSASFATGSSGAYDCVSMSTLEQLLTLEEGFWRAAGKRDAYVVHLADDAVHVFPGWGATTDNERVLQAVESVEPWETFSIDDPTFVHLGAGAAALVYTAHARRAGQDEYVAAMTSVYRHGGDGWELVIHQQTPL